jgi:hypothetical protein
MSQRVDQTKPLSDQDREYLLSRNELQVIDRLDALFPAVVETDEAESDEGEAEEGDGGVLPYEEWTADDLRAELGERKLVKSGSKPEMAARLRKDDESKA